MKTPISWLRDYVDINISSAELADKLVSCGFEIEEIIDLSKKIKGVITGKIVGIKKHENANKLSICDIDIGAKRLQIVTGAANVFEGAIVPVATDGAVLPNGTIIKTGELRGVLSEGMLCSGKELDVDNYDIDGAEIDGILILDKTTEVGVDINKIIGNDDVILDVAVTANRPDCNSIIGIAREISACLNLKLKDRAKSKSTEIKCENPINVDVKTPTLCPNYIAQEIKDIVITKSPKWLTRRLKMTGHKPYNNIVDLTNYILVELGQPMHAFDRAKIDKIVVRRATNEEKIVTLGGEEKILDDNTLVICDSEKPIAIAGVMGGLHSSISADTKNIVLESAKFAKESVRRTSRRINLRSDSSARYEKGIDLYTQTSAIERAIEIIKQEKWGTVTDGFVQVTSEKPFEKTLCFTPFDIEAILGIGIKSQVIVNILTALQFVTTVEGDKIIAKVPPYREDIDGVNDIAEEIIRFYGYDKIEPTLLDKSRQTIGGIGAYNEFAKKLKNGLVGNGLYEIITYSFTTPKFIDMLSLPTNDKLIKLLNPLGEDLSVMRTTLAHSMLEILSSNFSKGNKTAKLYEFAKTFIADALPLTDLPKENNILCIGMYGEDIDYYSLRSLVDLLLKSVLDNYTLEYTNLPYMHGGRTAEIFVDGISLGYFGEVHPITLNKYEMSKRAYIAEINLDKLFMLYDTNYSYKNISKYQPVKRDLAIVITKDITAQSILSLITDTAENLTDVKIFDVYEGSQLKEGMKSVAITMEFRADKTLTDVEIVAYTDKAINALRSNFNAQIRE